MKAESTISFDFLWTYADILEIIVFHYDETILVSIQ